MDLYVGNLPYEATWQELKDLFADYGQVDHAKVVHDRETGLPRGFGFVEMPSEDAAREAIADLNGLDWADRKIVVRPSQREMERGAPPRPSAPVSPRRRAKEEAAVSTGGRRRTRRAANGADTKE